MGSAGAVRCGGEVLRTILWRGGKVKIEQVGAPAGWTVMVVGVGVAIQVAPWEPVPPGGQALNQRVPGAVGPFGDHHVAARVAGIRLKGRVAYGVSWCRLHASPLSPQAPRSQN